MRPNAGLARHFQVLSLLGLCLGLLWLAGALPSAGQRLLEPGADGSGLLLVLLSDEDGAVIVDPETGETIARIPMGKVPHEVVVSPDGSRAYLANSGGPQQPGNSVSVLNLQARRLESTYGVPECTSPHGMALDARGERLWVSCAPERVVVELEPRSGKVLNRWATGQEGSWMLAATPSGDRLFTANLEGNSVTQVDPAAGVVRVVGSVEGAIGIDVSPDARELWVSGLSAHIIQVFHLPEGNPLARFSSGGKRPVRVRFTPDGKQVWVTHTESNTVDVFDAASRARLGSVALSEPAKGLIFSPDGTHAFVGLVAGDQVAVISVAERKLERLLRVGKGPEGMGWIPADVGASRSLRRPSYNNWHPAWSPDGSKIVFHSGRDGDDEIYVMNADGSGQTRLTFVRGRDANPAFSPDGRRIVFQSPRDSDDPLEVEIYVMNADGSEQTRLTRNPGFDGVPVFSPDGTKVAFQLKPPGPWEATRWQIYLMNPDGSAQVQLTRDDAENQVPNWSPDGRRLVYFSNREGDDDMYVMGADGANSVRLTNDPQRPDRAAAFSPDGERIAFMGGDYTDGDIYLMNADGSGLARLTTGLKGSGVPFWSPDGKQLLVNSGRSGKRDIYVINADGTGLRRLPRGGEGQSFRSEPATAPIQFPVEPEAFIDQFRASEGITFNGEGQLFIGANSAVWVAEPDGSVRKIADVHTHLGQAGIGSRDILAADFGPTNVFSDGPNDDGIVWRVTPEGEKTVVATGIADPNFVLVLPDKSFLVSDDGTDKIYRVQGDSVSVWSTAVPYPNGMALSRDESVLYVAQIFSALNPPVGDDRIWAIPLDNGLPAGPPTLAVRTGGSFVDGLVADEFGRIYIADNGAGKIWRFDPNTTDLVLIAEGMPNVATLVFGEGDFDREAIYATSTMRGGGTIWKIRVGAKGGRVHR